MAKATKSKASKVGSKSATSRPTKATKAKPAAKPKAKAKSPTSLKAAKPPRQLPAAPPAARASGGKPRAKASVSAAKPRAKVTEREPRPSIGALRGAALAATVIQAIEAEGGVLSGCGIPDHPARGMAPEALAKLRLPNGKPLPPSLKAFLAYDESYLGVLEDGKLLFRSFTEMMRAEFDDETAMMFASFERILPGRCLVVPEGSDSRRFMYVGEPDDHGEYPVFIVDTDELPWVGLAYPGLDVYLADDSVTTVLESEYLDGWKHAIYAPMLEDQARRNFAGFKALDYQDPVHVDGERAAQAGIAPLLGEGPSPDDLAEFS